MIIHCSGGIGRSGTFTALYSLYRLLLQYQQVRGAGDFQSLLRNRNRNRRNCKFLPERNWNRERNLITDLSGTGTVTCQKSESEPLKIVTGTFRNTAFNTVPVPGGNTVVRQKYRNSTTLKSSRQNIVQ
jgi:hypothetical protein